MRYPVLPVYLLTTKDYYQLRIIYHYFIPSTELLASCSVDCKFHHNANAISGDENMLAPAGVIFALRNQVSLQIRANINEFKK